MGNYYKILQLQSNYAVVTLPIYTYQFVDNTDPGCTTTGSWTVISNYPTETYGANFLYGQITSATATYTFTGLTPGVSTAIAATWFYNSGNASAAPFTVYD